MAAVRRSGALQRVRREVDELQKQVDALVLEVQMKVLTTEELLRRCQELEIAAEKTQKTLMKRTKADEVAPVGNFDQRKLDEQKRLQNILENLQSLFEELSPPGPSSAAREESKDQSGDDEEDEEDSDDDDEDELKAMEPPHRSMEPPHQSYVALSDFKGEQDGDLSVQKGEELKILKKAGDGWWLAEDANGRRGVVPKTFLKIGSGVEDEDDDDDDDDDEDDESELSEEEEEGDGEDRTDDQQKQSVSQSNGSQSKWSQSNWSTVRKALAEVDTADVLSAMGAIPAGFRPSTLNQLLVERGPTHRASHYLQPELSQSQLSFSDLFLDADTGRVRGRQVRTSVVFSLWRCQMIPTPGVGVQVLSRHVRLCAFDGTQVLSNIHTVRATYNVKSPKTWNFSPRMTGLLPVLLDGDCFLRCNSASVHLGILFELGVTFIRTSTGERGELSCGWAFLRLSQDQATPTPNRTYELPVNGGTPFEKDVAVETTVTRGSPGGVIQQMLQARRNPRLIVKLKSVNTRLRNQLSVLPDALLHTVSCAHLLVLHRQLLADALLLNRTTMNNADLICSPVLSTFPVLLDQTDLLDALRLAWLDAETNMSRAQRRDLSFLKQEFSKVYMSSVYFLLHAPLLPGFHWADPPSEEQRARLMFSTLEALRGPRPSSGPEGRLRVFVEPTYSHLAFDVTELTFDLLKVVR